MAAIRFRQPRIREVIDVHLRGQLGCHIEPDGSADMEAKIRSQIPGELRVPQLLRIVDGSAKRPGNI